MRKCLMFLILVILVTSACTDKDQVQYENIVGQWTITEVIYDGGMQPEWTGRNLVFEQTNPDRGRYSMIDTKYDSIWSSSGTWTKSTSQFEFILDDNLPVTLSSANNELIVIKYIPWTQQSTCDENGICLTIVTGRWEFRFKRK